MLTTRGKGIFFNPLMIIISKRILIHFHLFTHMNHYFCQTDQNYVHPDSQNLEFLFTLLGIGLRRSHIPVQLHSSCIRLAVRFPFRNEKCKRMLITLLHIIYNFEI